MNRRADKVAAIRQKVNAIASELDCVKSASERPDFSQLSDDELYIYRALLLKSKGDPMHLQTTNLHLKSTGFLCLIASHYDLTVLGPSDWDLLAPEEYEVMCSLDRRARSGNQH